MEFIFIKLKDSNPEDYNFDTSSLLFFFKSQCTRLNHHTLQVNYGLDLYNCQHTNNHSLTLTLATHPFAHSCLYTHTHYCC